MTTYKLVMPEHLNHYGFLFGGKLLQWVDEAAWMAASLDYPGCHLVTIALDKVVLKKSAGGGSILRFESTCSKEGHTSTTYDVIVHRRSLDEPTEEEIFQTSITFVRVDDAGVKLPLR